MKIILLIQHLMVLKKEIKKKVKFYPDKLIKEFFLMVKKIKKELCF